MTKWALNVEADLRLKLAQIASAARVRESELAAKIAALEKENHRLKTELQAVGMHYGRTLPTACYRNPRTRTTEPFRLENLYGKRQR